MISNPDSAQLRRVSPPLPFSIQLRSDNPKPYMFSLLLRNLRCWRGRRPASLQWQKRI
ncbi:hypothetical protein Bca4012_031857 [Brassica carinata]|uniref:Uncharacterized protein n=1 Tax=Brassica oleracea var. oleracea TaxID=109376 RepID=A0A0D3BYE0_BRAOL